MSKPIVSVIVATHNRAELLPRAIESLQNQTYKHFEIIIVDDASQDHTPEVIANLKQSDLRIHSICSEKNIGPGAARNLGIAQAKGEFIAIMDDDDISLPERLEVQVKVMESNPEVGLVFSTVEYIDKENQVFCIHPELVLEGNFPNKTDEVFQLLYLGNNYIPNTTILTRSSIMRKFKYPSNPWVGEDWFLCLTMAASGVIMLPLQKPLVKMDRALDRDGLQTTPMIERQPMRRLVLKMTRDWLHQEKITKFKALHSKAMSNQYIKESRHYVGLKGLILISLAFALYPKNEGVKQQGQWYIEKLVNKMKQLFRSQN
jgi:glycosyltransferase involved in cell wall biosynthesis